MSKPRLQVHGIIDTLVHAQTVRDAFNLQLAGKDIFVNHGVQAGRDDIAGSIVFSADIRFNSLTDRDNLRDWIRARMRDDLVTRTWALVRSRVSWHL